MSSPSKRAIRIHETLLKVFGEPTWIVGLAKDIQFKNKRGGMMTLNLVTMVTKVDPMWLADVAPQLVKIETGLSPYFDGDSDSCFSTTKIHFNGQLVKEEKVADPTHDQAVETFADWLACQMIA